MVVFCELNVFDRGYSLLNPMIKPKMRLAMKGVCANRGVSMSSAGLMALIMLDDASDSPL